ncbi:hypothetical protein ACFWA4_34595 [Streptomyces sp. NPDC060011]|uniref:hypothetical protein n=1 Tax=unclassified Streptomyces TaxID=2593676 RepID=UPI00225ACA50|nr:hypothetical protein [Streptomyces sp. NBC_00687]MCX4918961.1 hypothetical protein [Streptomyces sp. NBC_00687]
MSERSVIVHPPTPRVGREVWVDGKLVGQARSLGELTVLLNGSGWPGLDEVDVAESPVIEWHGGGPEVWTPWADPWSASATEAGAKSQ